MRFYCLLIVFLLGFLNINAQEKNIPTDYFIQPIDIPFLLSGTFGELRSNHFHAGLDIKTQGRTGLPVVASAEGYISRIKIQRFGYGKALYIKHPNGYQTVYAHLDKFAPAIQQYVKEQQYNGESYEIELFPGENDFLVEQGELIAYSGNSGSSGGPHLHFEIRDEQSRPMNPLLFGFDQLVKDTKKPRIRGVYAYTISDSAQIEGKQGRKRLKLMKNTDGSFKTEEVKASGKIGFGVQADDQLDLAVNRNGIFRAQTYLNGSLHFDVFYDKFSFSETRYLNRMVDYGYYKEHKKTIQKLFIEPNNPLSVFKHQNKNGFIEVSQEGIDYQYKIVLSDYAGNQQEIFIPIIGKNQPITDPETKSTTDYFVQANHATAFEEENIDVYIPKGALYDDTYLDIKFEKNAIELHDYRTPIHKAITIGFDVSHYEDEELEQIFIANVMPWGTKYYSNTRIKSGRVSAQIKSFGRYELAYDRIPPTITPINVRDKKWMSNYRFLKLKIDDDLSGIDSYRATVNGKFILMEYDYKTKELVYDFNDDIFSQGKNDFKLIVTDKVGNTSIFEAEIYRKN
ncbi:MAG: M23 family metallopeptidase [Bacteroidota bacterium]